MVGSALWSMMQRSSFRIGMRYDNEPNRDTGVRARQSHRAVYFLMKSPRKVCLQPQLISEVRQRSLPSTRSRSTVVGSGFLKR
jgi:hypothetical protein